MLVPLMKYLCETLEVSPSLRNMIVSLKYWMWPKLTVQCVQFARALTQYRTQETQSCISGKDLECALLWQKCWRLWRALCLWNASMWVRLPHILHCIHYVLGICWISPMYKAQVRIHLDKKSFLKRWKDVHTNTGLYTHPSSLISSPYLHWGAHLPY